MDVTSLNIMPITKARSKLGDLTKNVSGRNYIVLTRGGEPEAALVDFSYLTKLEEEVRKIYKKTFIDPSLTKYTREFSDKEIKEWLEEDELK